MSNTPLLQLSKIFLLLAPFSVDIVIQHSFFPFITGKVIFFRVVIELALFFFLLSWARGEFEFSKRQLQPLLVAVALFVSVTALAGTIGDNPAFSWWSSFERNEGIFQLLHYFIFFWLLTLLFTDARDWQKMITASLAAALIMILYGLSTAFSGDGRGVTELFSNRFAGSLGNPVYVGGYLLATLFLLGHLYLLQKLYEGVWRTPQWLFMALAGVFLLFLILSQTRGAILGLIVGAIFSVAYLAWRLHLRNLRIVIVTIFVSLFLLVGFRAVSNYQFSIPACSLCNRVLNTSLSDPTVQPRLWTWGAALQGIQERPLLGWGPENFYVAFNKYFDTRLFNPKGVAEVRFDRAHNMFLDLLIDAGTVGLLSFLGIFAVYYRKLFRKVKRVPAPGKLLDKVTAQETLLFSFPIAYFVQGMFFFNILPMYIPLFTLLALSASVFTWGNESAATATHYGKSI